jgi:hypothetical protein
VQYLSTSLERDAVLQTTSSFQRDFFYNMATVSKRKITPVLTEATLKRIRAESPESISPEENKVRKISTSILLTPPPSTQSPASELNERKNKIVLVPTELHSIESYQFMGFTEQRAGYLYGKYLAMGDEDDSFLIVALNFFSWNPINAYDDSDDWGVAMDNLGIRTDLQKALLKMQHRGILLTRDLLSWLTEIVEINYSTLESMDWKVETYLNTRKEPHLRGGEDDESESESEPTVPKDHTRLYKSLDASRLSDTFLADGSIDLVTIMSHAPTDFTGIKLALYFTPQRWVADRYAALVDDAVQISDVRTLELHVPNKHLEEVTRWDLPFGDSWRQVLFYSRKSKEYPHDWRKDHSRKELIVGPIAHNHNHAFRKMKSWTEVGEHNILRSQEGETALQYVWMKTRTVERLQSDVQGKFFLHQTYRGFRIIKQPWNDQPGMATTSKALQPFTNET